MLVCTCGTILVSNGYMWHCPLKGQVTSMDKEKETHKGVIIPDRRVAKEKHGAA